MAKSKNILDLQTFTKAVKDAEAALSSDKIKNPSAILRELGISSPLLITCSQALRIKRLVAWLKEKIFEKAEAEQLAYFGSEITRPQDANNIKAELANQSLFSKAKLLTIYEADKIKAAIAKPLADAIQKGTGDTFVIVSTAALNTKTPLPNYIKDSAQLLTIADFNPAELTRWIQQEAKAAGAAGIEQDALRHLMNCHNDNLSALSNELAKLALLVLSTESITLKLVQELSVVNPEQTSFELFAQIGKKNLSAAMKLAKDLLAQGMHPLQLSSFLSRCYRTLIANFDGQKSASSELSNFWFLKQVSAVKKAFTFEDLRKSIEALKEMDQKLKSSSTDEELLFTMCVEKLVYRKAEL